MRGPSVASRISTLGAALAGLLLAGAAHSAPGEPDSTFAGVRKTLTSFGYGEGGARAAEVQADGMVRVR